MYSIVETSPTSVTVHSTSGNNETQLIDRFEGGVLGGIAVSPKLSDGGRFLFCVTAGEVNRYKITDSGITFEENIANFEDFELENFRDLTELDLFWEKDEENFEGKLGWGLLQSGHAITIDLDESGKNIGHTVSPLSGLIGIVGFEFANGYSDLFLVSARDNSQAAIYYKLGTNPYAKIQGSENYWSHIERGRDGKMYVVNTAGTLGSFNSIVSVNSTGISINSQTDHPGSVYSEKFYTLPDQVDGVNNVFDDHYNNIESAFKVIEVII
jgi:hypothetical protein